MKNWLRWLVSFLFISVLIGTMIGMAILLTNYFFIVVGLSGVVLLVWVLTAKFKWEVIDPWIDGEEEHPCGEECKCSDG